jgi:hypothetical protein
LARVLAVASIGGLLVSLGAAWFTLSGGVGFGRPRQDLVVASLSLGWPVLASSFVAWFTRNARGMR